MTFRDLKHKDLAEPKAKLNPDPIFSSEVDVSDCPPSTLRTLKHSNKSLISPTPGYYASFFIFSVGS